MSKRCIFPALKEITLCFSTWKVLVTSSVSVVAAYKIHLRTSLLLLQFYLSHYITDTFEKAPQDIILQFLCSSQVLLHSRILKNQLFYISSRMVCAAEVLLLSRLNRVTSELGVWRGVFCCCVGFVGFFKWGKWPRAVFPCCSEHIFCGAGWLHPDSGWNRGSTAGIWGILAMHHYLRFLTNRTAANSLCL